MTVPLNQFITISLSDSRILIRFFIVLAKPERVLSSPKLSVKETIIKYKELLKKILNKIGSTIDPYGTPDIISSKALVVLLFMLNP